jgi:hypothetical protein
LFRFLPDFDPMHLHSWVHFPLTGGYLNQS